MRFLFALLIILSNNSFCYSSVESDSTLQFIQIETDRITPPTVFLADTIEQQRTKAAQLDKEVSDGNLTISNLNELAYLRLPVGIQKQIGPLTYTIIFSSMEGTHENALLEAYFMFEIPNTGDKIAFRGSKIPYSNKKGFTGRGRLDLIGDYHIVLNKSTLLTIAGKGKSFVEFDCDGFSSMGLEANLEFSRDLIIPEDENGKAKPAPNRVQTNFVAQIQNWNDILIGINLPNFQVNGLKDVSFNIHNAYLDWSDLMNPSSIQFPQGYVSPFLESGQPSLWQGVFIEHLDVKLPKAFAKKKSQERVTIGVQNMILDDQGFTGKVFAENVLSAGDMSGWAFTINKVSLDLMVNEVKGFEVSGGISVPGLKEAKKDTTAEFAYLAHRGADGNYLFAVTINERLRMPLILADLNLRSGSMLTVTEKNDKFYPSVSLNGDLTISNSKAALNQIMFEGLRISTEEPKFDFQSFGFGNSDKQRVSDFPVVIKSISVERQSDKIGLGVDLTINIGGSPEEGGFGGGGKVIVWAKKHTKEIKNAEGVAIDSDSEWKFDRVEIGAIELHASKPNAFKLDGRIIFFDEDPTYGKGFQGTIEGTLGKIGPIRVNALFGKTSDFRYWYADALVTLPTRVPVVPGVMFANAFGGGFFYKMRQTDQKPTAQVGNLSQKMDGEETSVYYVPDANSFGIKAIMGIEALKKEAMNGTVMLELMMNRHGGINSVTLTGNADFMFLAELGAGALKNLAGGAASGQLAAKLGALPRGQVNGNVRLSFDNVNDVFHGTLEVFVNVAGGMMRGIGANSRAGWAVLHFEKSNWYIHIGTPTDPLGLEVARIFQSRSYFMLGKNLPGSPPPPSQVTEILGNVDLDYMRDMNALESGMGFAFGLHFIVDTGDLNFLMFYGRFAAGTGLDFMLKDYGSAYHCQGSSGPMGINGWYANGQAYAFVMGKVGIKVNLKFYKGNFDILSIGAAAILQAKGPNPFWMKGTVGGYYSILGGMVKGKCNFEVEVGKKCVPVGEQNVLADQQMIAEISPADGATKVDVFSNPQVAFNIPVGEVFEISDAGNAVHFYRATLSQFEVFDSGVKLDGTIEWNQDKNVAVFDAFEVLPGEKAMNVRVKLAFEERKNNVWSKVNFQGVPVEEIREVNFQTDKAPDYIPKNNVLASYPGDGQLNFLPQEYGRGIIQLRDGQAYLFGKDSQWMQRIRITNISNSTFVESDFDYVSSEKRIVFNLPMDIVGSTIYDFEILKIPRHVARLDANVISIETQLDSKHDGSTVLTTKDISEDIARLEVKSMYQLRFHTSRYKTFAEKLSNISFLQTFKFPVAMNVFRLHAQLSGNEYFDHFELNAIRPYANLTNNSWYSQYVYPFIYEGYPLAGFISLTNRDSGVLGIPPAMAVSFYAGVGFNASQVVGQVQSFTNERLIYDVGVVAFQDYRNLQSQVANHLSIRPDLATPRLVSLVMNLGPRIRYGYYDVSLAYVIPGYNITSSVVSKRLFNESFDND